MRRSWRIFGYLALLAAVAAITLSGPTAWATPGQSNVNQTVPTRTPKPPPRPTDPDPETSPDTPVAPAATVTPGGPTPLPVTPIAPIAGARLALEKRSDRDQVWPGLTVLYTLTLSNVGAASAQQVAIEDPLPAGLEPGAIVAGSGATWDQGTLRARIPVLPPGGKYTVSFTARVAPDAGPGPVLLNRAGASAAGGLAARAASEVILPPVELPPVGGDLDSGARGAGLRR